MRSAVVQILTKIITNSTNDNITKPNKNSLESENTTNLSSG